MNADRREFGSCQDAKPAKLPVDGRAALPRERDVVPQLRDRVVAVLYGVETKALNRAVGRNVDRFPSDFVFQLTRQEVVNLRCQIGTSSSYRGRRKLQRIAVLSP
jgi:hypothetical protein